jgi:hypothetical protein
MKFATLALLGAVAAYTETNYVDTEVEVDNNLEEGEYLELEEGADADAEGKPCITVADTAKAYKGILNKDHGKITGWDLFGAMTDWAKINKKALTPEDWFWIGVNGRKFAANS